MSSGANFDSNASFGFGNTSSQKRVNNNGLGSTNFAPYQFSQDEPVIGGDPIENVEEDGQCSVCNTKKLNDNWICCDACQNWFHYSCVGVNQFNMPKEDESWFCSSCKRTQSGGNSSGLKRGFSEFGGPNILDDA